MFFELNSYIYTGISFSTFSFNEISLLCLKYSLSRFRKKKYFSLIKEEMKNYSQFQFDDNAIKYYIHSEMKSLVESSVILSSSKKEIKLATKYLNKEPDYSSSFKIIDLSNEIKMKKACMIVSTNEEKRRNQFIVEDFSSYSFIVLEDILKEIKEKTNTETLLDEIKLKILQDNDSEIYFIRIDLYSNILSNFVYSLNKMGILF